MKVLVCGAGLAGAEAAWFLAQKNISVVLAESKRIERNPAQKVRTSAELVCTNSLKSTKFETGHGILKLEMKALGSLVLQVADEFSVPAGDALAVDRDKFSMEIHRKLSHHPRIEWRDEVVGDPEELRQRVGADYCIVATGPLTHPDLEQWLTQSLGDDDFYFYDAIAPVVDAETLDLNKLYTKDRWAEDFEGDYLNAAMNKEEYENFVQALIEAKKVPPAKFEKYQFFESCLPVDIMAERGVDTPRFSCMKPIGLNRPDGSRPYAVVQLRKENLLGSAYNLVGFQNRLLFGEQVRVFRMIPGFENAEFLKLGSVHRNSFLNSKALLNWDLSSKNFDRVHFAGQITGVEGYTESASMGLYVAYQIWKKLKGEAAENWPVQTAIGALVNYIMTWDRPVPSNINMGLFPPVELTRQQRKSRDRKRIKKELVATKAQDSFQTWMGTH